MRPKHCRMQNFGSFADAEFSFDGIGLTMVSGPTGSGKSTLADFVIWTAYGVTSKEGGVDDVRMWGADGPTIGILDVETPSGEIQITRIRGTASQNDLFWTDPSEPDKKHRGKNLAETQSLLDQRLGIDGETFILVSHFGQFSTADQFFFAKAKDRRAILERIADVTSAVRLAEAASEARKSAKQALEALEAVYTRSEGRLDQLVRHKMAAERDHASFERTNDAKIKEYKEKSEAFEDEKAEKYAAIVARIEFLDAKIKPSEDFENDLSRIRAEKEALTETKLAHKSETALEQYARAKLSAAERERDKYAKLTGKCPTCLGSCDNPNKAAYIAECNKQIATLSKDLDATSQKVAELEKALQVEDALTAAYEGARAAQSKNNEYLFRLEAEGKALEALESSENVFADRLEQVRAATNPYVDTVKTTALEIQSLQADLNADKAKIQSKVDEVACLTRLYDLSFVWRGELLLSAVSELEQETNRRLEEYFDGVFRVKFSLEDSDKLEVEISNNGNACSYRALSGGERRQLVLSFWGALSKRAASAAGAHVSLVTLDESFNGLSDDLKVKAFRLLEEISVDHESVIVIDHSEALKALFDNRFEIEKQGEISVISGEGLRSETQAA